jgi:hypothetical protein
VDRREVRAGVHPSEFPYFPLMSAHNDGTYRSFWGKWAGDGAAVPCPSAIVLPSPLKYSSFVHTN